MFECLINTVPQNTTINQHQSHNTIQNLEIWNTSISSLISNTTELINESNTTYTSQSPTNKTQPILTKHEYIKTQATKTKVTTKTNY